MGTRPSEKKLIAALGIAAGAGVALAWTYQGTNKKGRILRAVKGEPEGVRTNAVSVRNSLAVSVVAQRVSRTAAPDLAPLPPPAEAPEVCREPDAVVLRSAEPVAVGEVAPEPVIPPAPAVLSRRQRLGAAGVDVAIICFACCVFVAICRGCHGDIPMDQFEARMLACSVALITVFYEVLFKVGGRRTAGQVWLTARGTGADDFAPTRWVPRMTVPRKYVGSPLG